MTVPPFDFSHYFTYFEIDQFLRQLQQQFPTLVTIKTIGQSYAGRDIWMAIIV
ncbi:MAG: M14 family zinc carboxypeptidase [Synechocystis sp.]|jgi:hypothetical protein